MKPSGRLAFGILALSAALLTPSAQACDDAAAARPASPNVPAPPDAKTTATDTKSSPSAVPTRGPALPRVVVTRDKESGQIRLATPQEIRALAAAPRATILSTAGSPILTTLPDGTKSLALTDRYFSMAVAKKGTDGRVEERCVGSEKEKLGFLSAVPADPAKPTGAVDEK